MALAELTQREAVLAAMQEYDVLGQEAFLKKYSYSPARRYRLIYDGKSYDSKAICGVAFGHQFPDRGPLQNSEFSGGEATVVPLLEKLGFNVEDNEEHGAIRADDLELIRLSRTKSKYAELSLEELAAYQRVHIELEKLGSLVRSILGSDQYSLKLTSSFTPKSGVRGYLPKDLWFAVSNERNEAFIGMPQLFMIVSDRGIEYGFAASINPSDFSDRKIQQRVREVAPDVFQALPSASSPEAIAWGARLTNQGNWFFRRRTRSAPNIADFQTLDDWLSFLRSEQGSASAAGSISRYISVDELRSNPDLVAPMQELASAFAPLMAAVTPPPPVQDPIKTGIESFLGTLPSIKSTIPFGQHDALKATLNAVQSAIQNLPAVRGYPEIKVSWSLGQGNWARVPWIALMDHRETTSTQRGIYGVILFREDMSGFYVTLNQGVTEEINRSGRAEGRRVLRERAQSIRAKIGGIMPSYLLDDGIKLNTEGALGLDYEASTIAYRYYAREGIPDDQAINKDVAELLAAYTLILEERPVSKGDTTQWWIFQANPKIFDIDGALRNLSEMTWTVSGEASNVVVGDRIFVWRSGRDAGIIALATVIEPPSQRENSAAELPYLIEAGRFGGERPRVVLRIDERLEVPLLRTVVATDAQLKDLMILRFANYGTFKLPHHHSAALLRMIEDQPSRKPTSDVPSRRVWIYSPGQNAEFWDEFYEDQIMAIGWDDLGDLSQYGSIDDYVAALQSTYQPERHPTNDARACYDFARSIQVGDRILVKRGLRTIVGYGTVVGEYRYDEQRPHFKNVRSMRWEGRGTWESQEQFPVKTLTDLTDATQLVGMLEALILGPTVDQPSPAPAPDREAYTLEQAADGIFMDPDSFTRMLSIWRQKKNLVLQGPPGVGKSFVAKRLAYALMGFRDPSRVRTVQFHQSYSYEDFVQGYRPSGAGLKLQQGVFVEFCERARTDTQETYVFIIDEINRGNLSKIFGELMLLIEPDKRSPEWATKLAYAPAAEERFYIPANVFLLGMMNTADRSLSLVDYALRRRFAFIPLRPQYHFVKFKDHLATHGVPKNLINLIIERMSALNETIEGDTTNLGPGFSIGHSFFVPGNTDEEYDWQWYRRVMDTEIIPLLEEYWFDNPARTKEWRDRLLQE